jgi:hypothetical protein
MWFLQYFRFLMFSCVCVHSFFFFSLNRLLFVVVNFAVVPTYSVRKERNASASHPCF